MLADLWLHYLTLLCKSYLQRASVKQQLHFYHNNSVFLFLMEPNRGNKNEFVRAGLALLSMDQRSF